MPPNAWRLSALEFHVAWRAMDRDRLPFPLTLTSTAATEFEFEQQRAAAAGALYERLRVDDTMFRALHALVEPLVRVELLGHLPGERRLRLSAGIDNDLGALATQEEDGSVVLALRPHAHVVRRVLAVLPECPPGTGPGFRAHPEELRADGNGMRGRSHALTPRDQAVRLLEGPHRCYTEIRVDIGPALDGWQEGGEVLQVVDRDDGRYLVTRTHVVEAVSGTPERLAAELGARVEAALAKAREPLRR
ncbi:ESX secretion-associated protein EspG [Nocardia sp. NPDC057227]|uniref:ESX secretion-associated protein EspG n=1 Tax=Nocardia sp. NPDC057227 TaxID=3346056 RepID=UPI003641516E